MNSSNTTPSSSSSVASTFPEKKTTTIDTFQQRLQTDFDVIRSRSNQFFSGSETTKLPNFSLLLGEEILTENVLNIDTSRPVDLSTILTKKITVLVIKNYISPTHFKFLQPIISANKNWLVFLKIRGYDKRLAVDLENILKELKNLKGLDLEGSVHLEAEGVLHLLPHLNPALKILNLKETGLCELEWGEPLSLKLLEEICKKFTYLTYFYLDELSYCKKMRKFLIPMLSRGTHVDWMDAAFGNNEDIKHLLSALRKEPVLTGSLRMGFDLDSYEQHITKEVYIGFYNLLLQHPQFCFNIIEPALPTALSSDLVIRRRREVFKEIAYLMSRSNYVLRQLVFSVEKMRLQENSLEHSALGYIISTKLIQNLEIISSIAHQNLSMHDNNILLSKLKEHRDFFKSHLTLEQISESNKTIIFPHHLLSESGNSDRATGCATTTTILHRINLDFLTESKTISTKSALTSAAPTSSSSSGSSSSSSDNQAEKSKDRVLTPFSVPITVSVPSSSFSRISSKIATATVIDSANSLSGEENEDSDGDEFYYMSVQEMQRRLNGCSW